jgi:hypothetical protein
LIHLAVFQTSEIWQLTFKALVISQFEKAKLFKFVKIGVSRVFKSLISFKTLVLTPLNGFLFKVCLILDRLVDYLSYLRAMRGIHASLARGAVEVVKGDAWA